MDGRTFLQPFWFQQHILRTTGTEYWVQKVKECRQGRHPGSPYACFPPSCKVLWSQLCAFLCVNGLVAFLHSIELYLGQKLTILLDGSLCRSQRFDAPSPCALNPKISFSWKEHRSYPGSSCIWNNPGKSSPRAHCYRRDKDKATSRPNHGGKHLKQKQCTSVVVLSELVATNATFVCYICIDRPITAKLRFRDNGAIFLFDATRFKSSAGVCISYTPTLQWICIMYALALGHYTPAGLVRIYIYSLHTSALWYNYIRMPHSASCSSTSGVCAPVGGS